MKLIVDEMPKRPSKCPFKSTAPGFVHVCKNDGRICGIRPGDHCRWLTVSKEKENTDGNR